MRAVSVRQPWAEAIRDGRKTIEVRSWYTHHRGDILICAALTASGDARHLPRGCARCVVNLVECRPFEPKDAAATGCDWEPGQYAWVLDNVRPTTPFSVRGQLLLFNVNLPVDAMEAGQRSAAGAPMDSYEKEQWDKLRNAWSTRHNPSMRGIVRNAIYALRWWRRMSGYTRIRPPSCQR